MQRLLRVAERLLLAEASACRTHLITQSVDGSRREGWYDISAMHQRCHKGRAGGRKVQRHACRAGNGPRSGR